MRNRLEPVAMIVLDLSKTNVISIRPRNESDELRDPSDVSVYWLRTPYGNILTAFGPEGLGSLLAMKEHMDDELRTELRMLLNSLFDEGVKGLEITITYKKRIELMSLSAPSEKPTKFYKKSDLLDEVARISAPQPGY